MPLLRITTSTDPAPEHAHVLQNLSRLLAQRLAKPESYMMTAIEYSATMTFAGTTDPTCFVELKNVGNFRPELTERLSGEICERLSSALGVPKDRIYVEFSDAQGYLWGHDGVTFS
jgi:phenylpyruvate tautomerase